MKKLFSILAILMVTLSAMAAIDPVEPTVGDGSTDNPYKIGTPGNLVWFANQVNGGQTKICAKLTADIDLGDDQTTIGIYNPGNTVIYKGSFDGDYHSIKINYTATNMYTALFPFISGESEKPSIIKNLTVTGTINTAYQKSGGLAGYTSCATFINCVSKVTINSTIQGAGYHGGFVGESWTDEFNNCIFQGKLLGTTTTDCGGFIGYEKNLYRARMTNCCFDPEEITVSTEGSCTFYNYEETSSDNGYYGALNCYYTKSFGEVQGNALEDGDMASGKACYLLNRTICDGTQGWYQNLSGEDKDAKPVANSNHSAVYGGQDACPSGTAYSNQTHVTLGEYDIDGMRYCSVSGCSGYDCQPATVNRLSYNTRHYYVNNKGNYLWAAKDFNTSGVVDDHHADAFMHITSDIDISDTPVMLGDDDRKFMHIYGGNHTITVNYNTTEDYTGLVRSVNSIIIDSLTVRGNITTSGRYAAGMVASAKQISINNSTSEVTIESTYIGEGYHGGFVGVAGADYNTSIKGCAFRGKLLGANTTHWGGMVGNMPRGVLKSVLFLPQEVTAGTEGSGTLYATSSSTPTTELCFYKDAFGTAQGEQVTAEYLASGKLCVDLNGKWDQYWYQNLVGENIDETPVIDNTHSKVYRLVHNMEGQYYYANENHDVVCSHYDAEGKGTCEVCGTMVYNEPEQEGGAYMIGTVDELKVFASKVNAGQTDIKGKLTNDINISSQQIMIGTNSSPFSGSFDGDGHTITVDYTNYDADYTALFRFADGATISNLTTSGTIYTTKKYAAGIIGNSRNNTVANCISNIAITSSVSGDAFHAGLIAYESGNTKLTSCMFTGKLLGNYTTGCGGLVGYAFYGVDILNCVFAPSEVTVGSSNSNTFVNNSSYSIFTIYNSGYTVELGNVQGNPLGTNALANGAATWCLNGGIFDGSQKWYQNLTGEDVDAMPVFDNSHNTVYGDDYACPSTLAYSNSTHNSTGGFNDDGEKLCVNAGCDLSAEYQQPTLDSETNTYIISNRGQLISFARMVNAGQTDIKGKLNADINMQNRQNMIGTEQYAYSGNFDGCKHDVKVGYDSNEEYTALFRFAKEATISNLTTSGTIKTSAKHAAGIIGKSESSTLNTCASSVAITSTVDGDGTHGGLIANVKGTSTLKNCLFTGSFQGASTTNWGGLVGYTNWFVNITGCVFAPSSVNVDASNSCTLARYYNTINIDNSGYTTTLGTEQGKSLGTDGLASGAATWYLNNKAFGGELSWYQNLTGGNVDAMPVLDNSHSIVYGDEYACPLNLEYSNTIHTIPSTDFDANGEKLCAHEECNHPVEYQSPVLDNGTYIIRNRGQLINFAHKVNSGTTEINGKLDSDIVLTPRQQMIGTSEHAFKGNFDGNGYDVKVGYDTDEEYTALFRHAEHATISNLSTSGSINTSAQFAAGLVAKSYYNNISNCKSSVDILSSVDGDGTHGGFIANDDGWSSLTDCFFTGSLRGENTTNCGGLVGWSKRPVNITQCIFAPLSVTVSTSNSYTLARYDYGNKPNVINSGYTVSLGTEQGTDIGADGLSSGAAAWCLNGGESNGSQKWYQNLSGENADAMPVIDNTHGKVFFTGENYCPANSYCNSLHNHQLTNANGIISCNTTGCSYVVNSQPEQVDGVYQIANLGNLIWFANSVALGNTAINGILLTNIELDSYQTMIGTSSNEYSGTFDGNGHYINVHYTAMENNTALFRYVKGATIRNLETKGYINTGYQFAGGIVSQSDGETVIERCASSVAITSTYTEAKDGTHGGIVGNNQNKIKLTDVLFNGQLLGEKATNCGGLIGWSKTNATITNCLFYPSAPVTFSSTEAKTLSRGNNVTVNNSYYVAALGDAQGTQVETSDVTDGEACYLLNPKVTEGNQGWYQTLGTDACPVPFNTHGTVYYTGTDYCPVDSYTNNFVGHEIVEEDGCKYCNNCTLAVVFEPATYDEETSTYSINNKGNFCWFTDNFNNGDISANAKVKLTADIDLGNEQRMIGTSTKEFAGTFDGDGHTLTVNYEAKEKYTAPFHYVNGATIKKLRVAGDITTDVEKAAGIVGASSGNTNITNCQSSVTINWTKESSQNTFTNMAGVVAEGLSSGTLNISNVLFDGKMLGYYNTCNCYGFVGDSKHAVKLTNCLFCPEQLTVSKEYVYSYTLTSASDTTITNCYYTTALGTVQGTLASATDAISGKLCAALNDSIADGSQAWYQYLSSGSATADAYPVPFNTHGTVYAGDEAHPKTLAYSNETHVYVENDNGFLIDELCDLYKVVSAEYNDEAGAYVLKNAGNLVWFSDHVSKTDGNINAVMENDIDMSGVDFTPIGAYPSEGNKPYIGTFNGQGHRIKNLVVNKTNDLVGLFGCVSGNTTIKNLIIDKTCSFTRTSGYGAAGIVGCLARTSDESDDAISLTLDACGNEANVTGDINAAGLVGGVYNTDTYGNATVNITNCYNTGNIKGSGASNGESAAFIAYGNSNTTVKNCYNTGTVVGNWTGLSLVRVKNGSTVVLRNIYNLESVAAQSSDDCKTVTAFQVRIGDLCNKLRSGENATVWAQNLETDAQPVFGTAGLHYARAMANYQWGTVCLPFAIDSDDKVQLFAMTNVTTGTDGVMTFTPVKSVNAYTPCVFKKKNAEADSVMFTATGPIEAIEFTLTTNPIEGWTMTGTFEELTGKTGIYYISDDQFWYADADTKVPAFRAWFETTSSNPAKSLSIKIADGDATGISELRDESLELRDGKYVEKGKVMIIKNGKKYNTAGQVIR